MLQIRKLLGSRRSEAAPGDTDLSRGTETGAPTFEGDAIARGASHFVAGRFIEALKIVDDALAISPTNATLHFARGSTLFGWGRFHEALNSFERARDSGMVDFDLDIHLGWTYQNVQRFDDAEICFRRAVATTPNSEEALVALANLLETRGTLAAEAADFERHLSQWPKNYNALLLLAACRFHQADRDGGTATFREATCLHPGRSRAWSNLGVVLAQDEHMAEGLEALDRAFRIDMANGDSDSVLNYATVLREDGRRAEAMKLLEENLLRNPNPQAHWLRSVFLLESGQLEEGWVEHEFRWMKEPLVSVRKTIRRPVWAGQDLCGKTILLHAEQGLGDAIQFIRYARFLKERGARVLFDAFKGLSEIASDFQYVDEVPVEGPMPEFDYRIPLLSLPRVLGTTVDSIPAHVPYVKARPSYLERWSHRIAATDKLKVGLVWSGNPKHLRDPLRSVSLGALGFIGKIEGLRLYSLQKGSTAAHEITASGLDIVDLGEHLTNFCDTAAAISHLDLVITVDTSVAHLAGALAKPVWVMVPKPPDWRWLLEGETTPWYPTMRLFRQSERNRWTSVFESMEHALRDLAESRVHRQLPPFAKSHVLSRASGDDVPRASLSQIDETRYGIVHYLPRGNIAASLRYYGEYRHAELELMGRFIKPASWILDVGCGAAIVSLFLAEATGPSGHVIAYENDVVLHQLARQNLVANRVKNVTLLRRSLAAAHNDSRRCGEIGPGNVDWVDGLGLLRLDWIRIDSGADAGAVLAGASETLWRLRPWLYAEIESQVQADEVIRIAADHGYQHSRFEASLFRRDNYNRRADDIFGGQKAFGLFCIPEEVYMDVDL